MPCTARVAGWDYGCRVIDCADGRAMVFWIGRLDERMTALLGLDASLWPIDRPQELVEM